LLPEKYQKISIACSNDVMEVFSNFLLERNTGGIVIDDGEPDGQTILTAYLHPQKDKPFSREEIDNFFSARRFLFPTAKYRLISLDYIQSEDWMAGWKKGFIPVHVTDKIVVCPSWESYKVKTGEIKILIDPKMAFGTGHHQSTAQCLKALEKIGCEGKRVLDYGCGTGILAIAASKLGAAEVIALDVDYEAVECAKENFALNNVEVRLVQAEKFVANPPCDIVAANLSIDQIIGLYDELNASLKDGGFMIFSGIPYQDRQRFLRFIIDKPYVITDDLAGEDWISYIGMKITPGLSETGEI
jgi:ribosomal protein L11 methyltransferase